MCFCTAEKLNGKTENCASIVLIVLRDSRACQIGRSCVSEVPGAHPLLCAAGRHTVRRVFDSIGSLGSDHRSEMKRRRWFALHRRRERPAAMSHLPGMPS
jgi:hypothetical protein